MSDLGLERAMAYLKACRRTEMDTGQVMDALNEWANASDEERLEMERRVQ